MQDVVYGGGYTFKIIIQLYYFSKHLSTCIYLYYVFYCTFMQHDMKLPCKFKITKGTITVGTGLGDKEIKQD